MTQQFVELSEIIAKGSGSVNPAYYVDEHFELYSIPAFDAGEPEAKTGAEIGSSKQVVKPGDVLLSKIVPHIRRSWIVGPANGKRIIASSEWIVFRGERFDPKYLRHVLVGDPFHAEFMNTVAGVGGSLLRARPSHVAKIKIPLPPLSEQKRIAEILDRAEALRAKRRAALALLDELTQSIFLDMFGDPVSNPKGWELVPFDTVCESRLGKMLDAKQQTGKHLRPYLRNANVQWFRFDLRDVLEMDFDAKAREMFRLRNGDLLICEGGEPGRSAVWRGEIQECYYQKALHCARPRGETIEPDFLAWLLFFLSKRGGLGDHVTAATIAHLTGEKLKAMKICVPPITLLTAFVARVSEIQQAKKLLTTSEYELDQLFASLQHRAFRGEL